MGSVEFPHATLILKISVQFGVFKIYIELFASSSEACSTARMIETDRTMNLLNPFTKFDDNKDSRASMCIALEIALDR